MRPSHSSFLITAGVAGASILFAACGSSESHKTVGAGGAEGESSSSSSAVASTTSSSSASASSSSSGGPLLPALHVSGNKIVDSTGATVQLRGVDRAGTEYSCVATTNPQIFDGDVSATGIAAIAAWKANVVRVPLNEDCWLGINGVSPSVSGVYYTNNIGTFVTRLEQAGLYVILDLHWAGPSTFKSVGQLPMADADHAVAFWQSVATKFKDDPDVIFDLFNEPYVQSNNSQGGDQWGCWLNGCMINANTGQGNATNNPAYMSAGMQSMVTAIRGVGATQILMVGGLNYSNDMSSWLSHVPTDPMHNIAASFHLYPISYPCSQSSCWTSTLAGVAASYPVVTGELGENDCASSFITPFMTWADSAGVSYLGWAWNTANCSTFPALISDYTGTPTTFGAGYKAHLAAF